MEMPIEGKIVGRFNMLLDVDIGHGTEIHSHNVIQNSEIGKDNKIWNFVNIYASKIGDRNTIGSFCEIGGSKIGNNCKIEARVFMPRGVTIGNNVFIGPGAKFANDKYPKLVNDQWSWTVGQVKVEDNVAIGIGSTILPHITIGKHAFVAAASLVTSDVPPNSFAMGRPAHVVSIKVLKELGIT